MRRLIACSTAVLGLALGACSKPATTYTTKVHLEHLQVVHQDDKGAPLALEVGVEYPDCPGDQHETLQGNAEFARCMAKYKPGQTVEASVRHAPSGDGHYDSEVEKIGDCVRPYDPSDPRSYESVQVCRDVVINGVTVGFHCDRRPSPELLAKCPWFARK